MNHGVRDVEGLVARDARERDRLEALAVLLVVADDAGLAAQRALDGVVGHRRDEAEVLVVRARRAREVAGLLHHDLLGPDALGELLGEPQAGVDRVEHDVAEGVALHLLARLLHLLDDLGHARALAQEDVDVADRVHRSP